MDALKIPDLNLFNSKSASSKVSHYEALRNSPSKKYDVGASPLDRSHGYLGYRHDHGKAQLNIPQTDTIYSRVEPISGASRRYKEVADHYLDKRALLPLYPEPVGFVEPLPLYQGIRAPTTSWNLESGNPCYCQKEHLQNSRKRGPSGYQRINHNNSKDHYPNKEPYVKEETYRNNQNHKKKGEQVIRKDAYMMHTFRPNGTVKQGQRKPEPQLGNDSVLKNVEQNKSQYLDIGHKLVTNQSAFMSDKNVSVNLNGPKKEAQTDEAEVQTSTVNQEHKNTSIAGSLIEKVIKKAPAIMDKKNFEKALSDKRMDFHSIKLEDEDQEEFRVDFSDLQNTKDRYIEESRNLLYKLNELSEDKKEFNLVTKLLFQKKKNDIFWPQEAESK